MKKLFFLLFLCTFLYGEVITDYHVRIDVLQSGSLKVSERIAYDFEQTPRHGIYRDIPHTIQTDLLPKDIGLSDFSVTMDGKNIRWKEETVSSDAGEMVRIKIGDPDKTITGNHLYEIRYHVKKGVLLKDDLHDAIRWNAIGTGWNVPIEQVRVDIFLPDTLSRNNTLIHTFTGKYGATSTSATLHWLDPHHLQVKVRSLAPHEGLTVEVAYAQGLLGQSGKANSMTSKETYLTALLPWGGMGLFFFYLYRFYKEHTDHLENDSVAPMYTPPQGLDVLQSGLLLDRVADTTDFPAAVIELAQKGYLDIFRNDQMTVFKKREKDTKALSEDEKYLLEQILFNEDDIFLLDPRNKQRAESIRRGFEKINSMLYKWVKQAGYMTENPRKARSTFIIKSALYGIPLLILAIATSMMTIGSAMTFMTMSVSIFIVAGIWMIMNSETLLSKLFGAIFAGLPFIGIFPIFRESDWRLLLFTPLPLLLIASLFLLSTYKKVGRYTPKGAKTYLHLKGLEEFIRRVKEDEIKRRLEEDPLFLDKLLPYAMLFGLSDHWLDFYEIFAVTPSWYDGKIDQIGIVYRDMHRMSTPPPSDSGGSSGGGSFSGGGGGGGGGGSW